ncbi:MAG: MOSC domain-containing protein [Acidobacteria bacterium]|nr:MOSC domain-containing protein [Acidobacteriota bacterium]
MRIKVGEVEALFRYPVKSMGGERIETADMGWHGLDGDRRLGLRRLDDRNGFPWLTASKLPEMILFAPERHGSDDAAALPTHVRTPEGELLALFGEELATEVGRRFGSPVEMVHLNRGIFDEASISLITSSTVTEVGTLSAQSPDVRRFRPNILMASSRSLPFEEEEWVGGVLSFGDTDEAAAIYVTNYDKRCSMVNLDPESARANTEVLKAIVRARDNKAGVYGTVTRRGHLTVGQPVFFEPAAVQREQL